MSGQLALAYAVDLPVAIFHLLISFLLKVPMRLSEPAHAWQAVVRLALAHDTAHEALGELLLDHVPLVGNLCPVEARARTCWLSLLANIRGQWQGSWQRLRALRGGVCLPTASATPCHRVPGCSGASLCPVGAGRLVLFGGRSVSGQTLGKTYVAQIVHGLARWEELHCKVQPGPRCYHSAVRLQNRMIMFGGAGSGTMLHDDTWELELYEASSKRGPFSSACTVATWRLLEHRRAECVDAAVAEAELRPSGRSSHVLAEWRRKEAVVLHGGLGNSGTMSDTWLLRKCGHWELLRTTGLAPARAHHCGAVVHDTLWLYAGQGDMLLTLSDLSSLDLQSRKWTTVKTTQGPRACIDAGAAAVDGVGLLVFGGVGVDFEFVPPAPWLLLHTSGDVCGGGSAEVNATFVSAAAPEDSRLQADGLSASPAPRACCSVCSDGLQVFVYGGFDGHQDLNDLWCLNLTPDCFAGSAPAPQQLDLLPRAILGS
mmetsp:Transcript_62547/g.116291  ORF Transcript_62547/g.116291 Transcript_62547/m.116291 type:complete len:485 (+) Transcript_62547:97-1551(+)